MYIWVEVSPSTVTSGQNILMYTVRYDLSMALLLLILYIHVRVDVIRLFVCANWVRSSVRTHVHIHFFTCGCSCILVSLHLLARINTSSVSYVHMRAFAYMSLCRFN